MRRSVPNISMASVSKNMILNPFWVRSSISFLKKAVDYEDRVEDWGPFPITFCMVSRDHFRPTSAGKLLDA